MIAFSNESLMVLACGCLILNYFAFRSDSAAAGHGRKQAFQMAAVWLTIIVGLTLVITYFQG